VVLKGGKKEGAKGYIERQVSPEEQITRRGKKQKKTGVMGIIIDFLQNETRR
jgi:hypothetical protein